MRAGVWCGAAALALLTLAGAFRTPQVEGASRVGRRFPAPSAPDRLENIEVEDAALRPRTSRRREEILGRERARTRSRPTVEATVELQPARNERFDSRRTYNRTRNKNSESNAIREIPTTRDSAVRSRTRPTIRERQKIAQPTQTPTEIPPRIVEETKFEPAFPITDVTPKLTIVKVTTPRADDTTPQFKRRSSTTPIVESITPRRRSRINTRVDTKALDLAVSGTTNTLTVSNKEPTTARTAPDSRNSKKLRYRQRLSDTDTNLTGEGLSTANEVTKSSQIKEYTTSQPEIQTVTQAVETTFQPSTEHPTVNQTLTKARKVVRRPLTRKKGNFRPAVSKAKKYSDEINEDDNYPESFKALIQAKNASTQTSSPPSENLSVKASQKVYNTYTSSPQSTNTGSTKYKYARFRSKIQQNTGEEDKQQNSKTQNTETDISSDEPKRDAPVFKLRSTFSPRSSSSRKSNINTSTTSESLSSNHTSEKPVFKYNRKFKPSTTETPKLESTSKFKRLGTNTLLKKSLTRPSYYSRRNSSKSLDLSSEIPNVTNKDSVSKDSNITYIKTLPRTSYYSRLRGKKVEVTSSKEINIETTVETPADKKTENSVDMPLIFSLLKGQSETTKAEAKVEAYTTKEPEREKKMFIIAVSSKESYENSTENEVPNKTEEVKEKITIVNAVPPTHKFHANYKDNVPDVSEKKGQEVHEPASPSRNVEARKHGRRRPKPEFHEDTSDITPNPRERNKKKFSDAYLKSTEPSTNGIPPETEKQKSRYSSKYRASYLDKPYYKPTVPTITPSTAWLKFFVTDPQLAKSVEEPYWFEGDDIFVTTEMSRQGSTAPSVSHETSLELVEGEEIQLGPDMNAISFTKTRSTLSSADLRLSESLAKPLHIMNVEASQHSPSVTVSIFDALAEILTSTPRTPRLSSTTEVSQKLNINDIQTLDGVSNSISVHNVKNLASQNTFTTIADLNLSTKSVQNTVQTTPIVINRQSVEEAVTPSLNTQDETFTPVNTPPTPTSPPVTPISARRPFAIKVLYTDTEQLSDKSTTTESIRITNQPSTDIPTTVHNTVSDFLLTNNHLVSSELTSMLSNNIKSIIQNMDQETKSKISLDMAKLLQTLIPKALDGLETSNDHFDNTPNTTPYSLEEIRDTENISIDPKNTDSDIDKNDIGLSESLQTVVTDNIVNIKTTTSGTTLGLTETQTSAVNSDELMGRSTLSESSSQTTLADVSLPNASLSQLESSTISTTPEITPVLDTATPSVSSDAESISLVGEGNRIGVSLGDNTNNIPLPFFTNFEVKDFTAADQGEIDGSSQATETVPIPLTKSSPFIQSPSSQNTDNNNIQNLSQVPQVQLWVLNKKARVLQMIENLIRQHNDEIATAPPLTDMLSQPNNIPLSNRLTQILNTMSSTTEPIDFTTKGKTSPTFFPSFGPFALLTTTSPQTDTTESSENGQTTTIVSTTEPSKTPQMVSDIFSRLTFTGSDDENTPPTTIEVDDSTASTTPLFNTVQDTMKTSNRDKDSWTTQASTETTTELINTETTQTDFTTSFADVESTTISDVNETKQNIVSFDNSQSNISKEPPKKDYVIFGILPNNTVVRKDPNEDILETLTEASPYIIYSLLPNNTVIRRFPNGTRVPRVMQKIDVLPISPWSLRNPYSPIHNNTAIVRPHNPIRLSTNIVTPTDISNNGTDNRLTNDTVNNLQTMIPTSLNVKDSSSLGVTTATNKPPAEKSTASHVLSLRTSTMLPSIDEILLHSISSAIKEDMVISSMMSSTREPTILTLDIDPETKQIRTERPGDGSEGTVFKFIPIDEVTVAPQGTNVLRLATKAPSTQTMESDDAIVTVTEVITQTPQIQTRLQTDDPTTTVQMTAGTPIEISSTVFTNVPSTFEDITSQMPLTTNILKTMDATPITEGTTLAQTTITNIPQTTTVQRTDFPTTEVLPTATVVQKDSKFHENRKLLQTFLATERNPKSLDVYSDNNQITSSGFTTAATPKTDVLPSTAQLSEDVKLLQAIIAANNQVPSTVSIPNIGGNLRDTSKVPTTTSRSIEDDIKQFEEDTKLLKALLAATGQNPDNFNIPSLDSFIVPTRATSSITPTPKTTTTIRTTPKTNPTITTTQTSTTARLLTTTQSVSDDLKKLKEDAELLQALLQAAGQNGYNAKPIISSVTSNVRISSDPSSTSVVTNPTTPINIRPVYTSRTTTPPAPVFTSVPPVLNTLQPQESTTLESGISSTLPPKERRRLRTTTIPTGRRAPASRFTVTTEIPSTSTFSDEEDVQFLKNLKTVLTNNPNNEDPEAALANRIIALAVERSLNEIESGKQANVGKTGITTITTPITRPTTTTTTTTTTKTTTTSTPRTTTVKDNAPSLEEDIKQFQEDTKLLQALIKATGQDPSEFKIPTLPPNINSNTKVSPKLPSRATNDLKLLSNLLASPSPLNEPFEPLTKNPKSSAPTTSMPFGTRIAVKDELKNERDDAKLLQTLIKLQGVTETTTQKSKLAITGQSPDEALKKLIQQTKPPRMMSGATKPPVSISTEYGKSNDALLAALLKEQGFGPTTASSLDEQLRLAALLNQVVVTPKARQTTTTPPPPPAPPRRPILDGLAWLWQQWRDTEPGQPVARPNRRPSIAPSPASSAPTSNRLNWLGSGPFVGNADEQPSSNRVPLEPPRVVSEQAPGRGQLVSAAINVTRAFSQFLGAAIAGAAQTVQNVIRAGQRAATDVYSTGSG